LRRGRYYLLDLRGCSPSLLDDPEFLREMLIEGMRMANLSLLGEASHHFTPQGVSGFVMAAGSHFSIHTWPEYGYASIDIYSSEETPVLEEIANFFSKKLQSRDFSLTELIRREVGHGDEEGK